MTDFVVSPFIAEKFAPTKPPPDAGREHAPPPPVAIIGDGPVGLATALGLERQGVRSTVIGADESVCFGSRAICISRRSLEIIERFGAAFAVIVRCCISPCRTTRSMSCHRWSISSSSISSRR